MSSFKQLCVAGVVATALFTTSTQAGLQAPDENGKWTLDTIRSKINAVTDSECKEQLEAYLLATGTSVWIDRVEMCVLKPIGHLNDVATLKSSDYDCEIGNSNAPIKCNVCKTSFQQELIQDFLRPKCQNDEAGTKLLSEIVLATNSLCGVDASGNCCAKSLADFLPKFYQETPDFTTADLDEACSGDCFSTVARASEALTTSKLNAGLAEATCLKASGSNPKYCSLSQDTNSANTNKLQTYIDIVSNVTRDFQGEEEQFFLAENFQNFCSKCDRSMLRTLPDNESIERVLEISCHPDAGLTRKTCGQTPTLADLAGDFSTTAISCIAPADYTSKSCCWNVFYDVMIGKFCDESVRPPRCHGENPSRFNFELTFSQDLREKTRDELVNPESKVTAGLKSDLAYFFGVGTNDIESFQVIGRDRVKVSAIEYVYFNLNTVAIDLESDDSPIRSLYKMNKAVQDLGFLSAGTEPEARFQIFMVSATPPPQASPESEYFASFTCINSNVLAHRSCVSARGFVNASFVTDCGSAQDYMNAFIDCWDSLDCDDGSLSRSKCGDAEETIKNFINEETGLTCEVECTKYTSILLYVGAAAGAIVAILAVLGLIHLRNQKLRRANGILQGKTTPQNDVEVASKPSDANPLFL